MIFYVVETADKLLVGFFQRIIRIEFIETGCIDYREDEIAQFLVEFSLSPLASSTLSSSSSSCTLSHTSSFSFQSKPTFLALS